MLPFPADSPMALMASTTTSGAPFSSSHVVMIMTNWKCDKIDSFVNLYHSITLFRSDHITKYFIQLFVRAYFWSNKAKSTYSKTNVWLRHFSKKTIFSMLKNKTKTKQKSLNLYFPFNFLNNRFIRWNRIQGHNFTCSTVIAADSVKLWSELRTRDMAKYSLYDERSLRA